MRLNELIEMVGHNDDEESKKVLRYLNSYQNQFASQILRSRISQKLTEQQASKKVELPLDEYLSYERGINMNASKAKYQRVLNKLNAAPERVVIFLNIPEYHADYGEEYPYINPKYSDNLNVSESDTITSRIGFKCEPAL